jgi:DNA-binding IclR family transcriptional regulator
MHPGTAALERGLLTLQALAEPDVGTLGLTVNEIAERLELDKSQASRTLNTLAAHGYVVRDPATQSYRLGPALFAIATRAREARIVTLAGPRLRALARALGETSHLSVRHPDGVLTLASETPADANLLARARVGTITPLPTTSAGRALATDLENDELAEMGFDGEGIAAVARARAEGIAIVRDEFEPGLLAAAAPVLDTHGRVIAAINVSAPTFRLEHRLDEAGRLVAEAASALSSAVTGATVGVTR